MKRTTLIICTLSLSILVTAQSATEVVSLPDTVWRSRSVNKAITVRWTVTTLFNSCQAIYVADIDASKGELEFGVAATPTRRPTSVIADSLGVSAAVNGTFFNMEKGFNVHFIRMNDSTVAFTDTKEFGIRATGMFSASGEMADISFWTGTREENRQEIVAEDIIVSGPLLIDDNEDILLQDIPFVTLRHPRSLVGITGDGHLLFVVVDGRQPGYAEGMNLYELRALARSLGCVDALNLDGGGSTTLYAAGTEGNGVVNKPSGGTERTVPSIIFVKTLE
jgi:exopolysaccharide biosynthesis protein